METPKGHPLAEDRHSSLSSTSLLESSHCLSPPGGLDAEPAAGMSVWQWGKKTNSVKTICLNNFLASVMSCACRRKQTGVTCRAQCLPPCCTADRPVSETEAELHTLRKIRGALYPFRPQILKYLLHFHRRMTVRINVCPLYGLKKKKT